MIGADRLALDPLVPWPVLLALAAFALVMWGAYVLRRGRAPLLRAIGLTLILIGLAQPMLVRESREPANDVVALIIDQSESLKLAGRVDAARAAGAALAKRLAEEKGLDLRVREVQGGPEGTALVSAMEEALADAPRDRIAGAILVTDGQVSDAPSEIKPPNRFGPIQALIVGDPNRGDRRLDLIAAPGFGIVGEAVTIEAQVTDPRPSGPARVVIAVDGKPVREATVETGKPFKLTMSPPQNGPNMVTIEVDPGPEEISRANNRAAFELQGVRDRLRVLLVTGAPYPGARVWRNMLKSDPSVDLVHFTILRPPEKMADPAPPEEMALIQFPVRELFDEKLDQFDLIIFDRYKRGSMLLMSYFDNIARHVENGGAMLIIAGEDEAGPDSLSRTPIAAILPSQPTGQEFDQPYRPTLTPLGQRHPVTRGLPNPDQWGRWDRLVEANGSSGRTLMSGNGRPLLVLDRAGEGRVAQLWSDQAWLWARGYDGGGPHGELLRRLAHWLMREPELEEERLTLKSTPEGLVAERSTLGDAPGNVDLTSPSGAKLSQTLQASAPGIFSATISTTETGLFEARSGSLRAFAAVGPLNPKEAANVAATRTLLEPIARASSGGVTMIGEDAKALPEIRRVDKNGGAFGGGWIGLRRNDAYVVRASASEPLGPGWLWATAGLVMLMLGWRREAG